MISINRIVLKQLLHGFFDFLSTISFSTYPNEQFGVKKLYGREGTKKCLFWGFEPAFLSTLCTGYRPYELLGIYSSSGMSKETIYEGI